MSFFDVTSKFFLALKSLLRKALLADAARFLMTFQTISSAKRDVTSRTYKLSSRHLMHLVFVILQLFRVLKFLHGRALMTFAFLLRVELHLSQTNILELLQFLLASPTLFVNETL